MSEADALAPAVAPDRRLGRDTVTIAALTAVSRLTGFVRIVVVAAVLGTGLLGDVYQSANTVPNLLFELLAGGALQAALVPLFVAYRRDEGEEGMARTVGVVLGTVMAALAVAAALTMVLSPLLARALTSAEPDQAVAADKVSLVTRMLVVFAPQLVFYGMGLVSAAALQARGRFTAAAIAPAVNNVVVIACYLVFDAMRGGADPTLNLTAAEIAVLAGGTTLAVIAFTSVPLLDLLRSTPAPLHVRISWHDDAVVRVRRTGGWAVLQVLGTLALTAGALVVGNGAPGGVAVYSLAFAVFLLPYALISAPVATATLPRLAAMHQAGDEAGFRRMVRSSTITVVLASLVVSIVMAVAAWPIAEVIVFGAAEENGPAPVAHALMAFAPGVVAYGVAFLLTRVLMSRGEVKTAAFVSLAASALGIVAMVVCAGAFSSAERAAAIALGFSVGQVAACVMLVPLALRRPT